MKFEHLIQINDPADPLIIPLSRGQLWAGLMARIDDPLPFLPGLESCTVIERSTHGIHRQLDFGHTAIEDRVTLEEGRWVRFDIQPSPTHAGGSLIISIEEPQPDALFLRFCYQTNLGEGGALEDRAYSEYVKSAYHQSDIDTVLIIRTLAAEGPAQ